MEITKMKNIRKNNILTKSHKNIVIPAFTLFLDIETTGFSGSGSRLYLIGTAYMKNGKLIGEQFFAETPKEESQLLAALDNLLMQFDTVITFYGNHFDLPFLEKCKKRLNLPSVNHNIHYVDLYETAGTYRHIFGLENYKLKTLERFLGIRRDEPYDPAELTKIYETYVRQPQEDLLHLLLTHNLNDILGMIRLLSLSAFDSFFNGGFTPVECTLESFRKMDGSAGKELSVSCRIDTALPAAVSCKNDCFYLHAEKNSACLRIPLLESTLKYFYPDYRNYYYLPDEDMAIHKSVAFYVDASHREKAKAANCYGKKTGMFLPQYEEVITPALSAHYKAPLLYFEWKDTFEKDLMLIKRYCMHILQILQKGI